MGAFVSNQVAVLKAQYDGKDPACPCVLSHGDLHPGSVMANVASGKVKVIDPEFTVYAPPGLDVGSLLSGFVLAAVHHAHRPLPERAEASAAVASLRAAAAQVEPQRSTLNTKH